MAPTDGLLHLFERHSFPRSALEAMMPPPRTTGFEGENPVDHGAAVLLEVEAFLIDGGRGPARTARRVNLIPSCRTRWV
jgi:hypothetical protein